MFSSQVDNSEGIAQSAIAEALVLIEKLKKSNGNQLAILKQDYVDLSQKLYDVYIANSLLSIETKRTIIKTLFDLAKMHNSDFIEKAFTPNLGNLSLPEVLALSYFDIFLQETSDIASNVEKCRGFLPLFIAIKLNDMQLKAYFAGMKVWPKDVIALDNLFQVPQHFNPERWNAVIDVILQLDLSEITTLSLETDGLINLNDEQWNSWMAGLRNIILHLKNIQIVIIGIQSTIELPLPRRTAFLSLLKDIPYLLRDIDFSTLGTMTEEMLEQQDQLCLKEDEDGIFTFTLKGNRLSCNDEPLKALLNPKNNISHLCLDYQDYQLEFSEWEKFLTLVSESCVIDLKLEGNNYQIPPVVKRELNKCCINHHFEWALLNEHGLVKITSEIAQETLEKMALNPYHPAEGLKYYQIGFGTMHIVGRDVEDSPLNHEKIEKVFSLLSRLMLTNVKYIDFSQEMLRDLNDATWKYFIEELSLLLLKLPSLEEICLRNADGSDIAVPPDRLISLIAAFSQTKDCVFRINPILLNPFSKEQVERLSASLQQASASIAINRPLLNMIHEELTNAIPDTDRILYPIFEKLQGFNIPIPVTCTLNNGEIQPFFAMIKADIFSFLLIKELKINEVEEINLEDLCKSLEESGIPALSMDDNIRMTSAMREKIKKILLKNAQTYALAHVNLKTGILFSIWSKVTDKNIDEKKKEALLSKLRECPEELHEQYYHLPYSHMKM